MVPETSCARTTRKLTLFLRPYALDKSLFSLACTPVTYLDMVGVTGSIPVAPTSIFKDLARITTKLNQFSEPAKSLFAPQNADLHSLGCGI